jgi:DNA (cytosine-5)-methyltransferase 1|tara:strand:+ start:743 stop:1744 length:1002 start_codon:yes stop_codon:yes gene_type:complete
MPENSDLGEKTVLEICAGAGGQALGLERAGFRCSAAIEIDRDACNTLRQNRPHWNVLETDLRQYSAKEFLGVDLLAGGVPCPPFSVAGKQLGADDERDLFPAALRLIAECQPKAVLLENVKGLSSPRFQSYRDTIVSKLFEMKYQTRWEIIYSSRFGLPQLRPRFVLVALREEYFNYFKMPAGSDTLVTVGDTLFDLMAGAGWIGAEKWKTIAQGIAPTIVGGSKKHGGADLGPTRAKRQWLDLGVDGKGIANAAPTKEHPTDFVPRLTNRMVARVQGFPDEWLFSGGKTSQYRQIGNAFPAPVAQAIGQAIALALDKKETAYESNEQLTITI